MINISKLTSKLDDITTALNGKWEYKHETLKDGSKVGWVILGKIAFAEDETSKNHFPYAVLSWHESDKGYWGILK